MNTDKKQILALLREELNRWEELLAGLSDAQILTPHSHSIMSTKDVVGHLRAWQQVSNARLEAAQHNSEPAFPDWLQEQTPTQTRKSINITHEFMRLIAGSPGRASIKHGTLALSDSSN